MASIYNSLGARQLLNSYCVSGGWVVEARGCTITIWAPSWRTTEDKLENCGVLSITPRLVLGN